MAAARFVPLITALGVAAFTLTGCSTTSHPQAKASPDGGRPAVSGTPGPGTRPPRNPTSYIDFDRTPVLSQVPQGWAKSMQPDYTDFRDPTGQLLLRLSFVDATKYATTRPNVYLRQLASHTARNYPGYKLLKLTDTHAGRGNQYAEWEFTFVKDGVTRHVIVAGVAYGTADTDGTGGQVYYSAPAQYFGTTSDAYLHALNAMDFAG
jgi:hypothetical protein